MIKMENEKDIGRDASEVKEREGKGKQIEEWKEGRKIQVEKDFRISIDFQCICVQNLFIDLFT